MTYQAQTTDKVTNIPRMTAATTTSSSNDTAPGVFLASPQDLEAIREMYVSILGPLNVVKASIIERALRNGVKPDAIIYAINETAIARRPSHAYLCSILSRYMTDGILDMNAILREKAQRDRARADANAAKWGWYASPEDDIPI